MSLFIEYAEAFGIQGLTLLSFYGTLSVIVLGALIVGVIAQGWKGRSGGLWAISSMLISVGLWYTAHLKLDPTVYTLPWGGDQGWGSLAAGVAGIVTLALSLAVAVLPAREHEISRTDRGPEPTVPIGDLSSEPVTPVMPRPTDHSFRRKFFAPMVVLGIAAFIAAGVLSVEKKQVDIFLRQLGLTKAEAPSTAGGTKKPTDQKAKTDVKAVVVDPLILQTQKHLLALGYKIGTVDGIAGGETDEAVLNYQKWEGLPRSGKITPELVKHLKKVKKARAAREKETPLAPEFQLHANMCITGIRAWYRSRTTQLSIDGLTQSSDKWEFVARVWYSYPGEQMERTRANAACKYSRYRSEMPEAPFAVVIHGDGVEETLSDREIKCFSQGQPC